MARVNKESHSFTCHPHFYTQVEWTIPAFTPQAQSITALWPLLIFRPAEGRRLSWLVTNQGGLPAPQAVTHPRNNRGPSWSSFVDRDQCVELPPLVFYTWLLWRLYLITAETRGAGRTGLHVWRGTGSARSWTTEHFLRVVSSDSMELLSVTLLLLCVFWFLLTTLVVHVQHYRDGLGDTI